MIFNLTVGKGEDDDGNAAGGRPQQQAAPRVNRQTPVFTDLMAKEFLTPHGTAVRPRLGPIAIIREKARRAAEQGRQQINDFCLTLTKDEYAAAVEPILPELEEFVKRAEARPQRSAVPRHNEREMADAVADEIAEKGWPQQPARPQQDNDLDIPGWMRRNRDDR